MSGRKHFLMKHALSGGFGGTEHAEWEKSSANTEEDAIKEAYEAACEDYEMYAGCHGLRDTDDIMEEDEVSYDEAVMIYEEERDSWLDYIIKEVSEEVYTSDNFDDIEQD